MALPLTKRLWRDGVVSDQSPERFREGEPLALPDWTAHAAQVVKGIFQIGDVYWTVSEARALRDWLNKALPEEKP